MSSLLLIRRKFQGYRCESDIAFFAWKVTWNYAYSHFKGTKSRVKKHQTVFMKNAKWIKYNLWILSLKISSYLEH